MNFEIFRDETSGKAVGTASTGPAFNAERSDPSARLFQVATGQNLPMEIFTYSVEHSALTLNQESDKINFEIKHGFKQMFNMIDLSPESYETLAK